MAEGIPKNYPTYDDDAALGKKVPSLDSLKPVVGELPSTEGKISVILFWAKFDKGAYPVLDEFSVLAEENSDVAFVGVSADPDEGQVKRYFDKGGKMSFVAAYDAGKEVNKAFKETSMLLALTTPHAFLVNAEGVIVWREQFGQIKLLKDGQFAEQLKRLKAGEALISNGNRPVEEEEEEEDADEDEDFGSLF